MNDFKLNSHHTFDNFLVGKSNTAARTVALAAITNPAATGNPLFLYGATGTGKTHLIQAITNALGKSSSRVWYRTREEFTNSWIKMLRTDAMPGFKEEIENHDFLLIDDIHFLADKERTQREFLQIFEFLISHSKRLVVTADRSPQELAGWNRNLIDLFEGGQAVCLNQADQELKTAILRQRALDHDLEIFDEVGSRIASTCSTVREVEGALNKHVAECSLSKATTTRISFVRC
jgi:chromosomal replication initiator protein